MIIAVYISHSCISFSQIINTVAGNGIAEYSGDGEQAMADELNTPLGLYKDAEGNPYITYFSITVSVKQILQE